MNGIDINAVDLNLLTVLDAFLAERHVTRAARRLGIGQPAASHALGRLRELFGDPLLVRSGRRMVTTPRADGLREPLRQLLDRATDLIARDSTFDAATTTRVFRLIGPDLLITLLHPILAQIGREAPRARVEVIGRVADEPAALERGDADLALVPALREGPGLRTRRLGTIDFGIVARRDHPAATTRRRLSARAWTTYPHVMVRSGSESLSVVGQALERAKLTRHVALVVPSFFGALLALSESDLLFAAPQQLVWPLLDQLDLVILEPPVPISALPVAAVWHERLDADPGHRFLRARLIDALAVTLAKPRPR